MKAGRTNPKAAPEDQQTPRAATRDLNTSDYPQTLPEEHSAFYPPSPSGANPPIPGDPTLSQDPPQHIPSRPTNSLSSDDGPDSLTMAPSGSPPSRVPATPSMQRSRSQSNAAQPQAGWQPFQVPPFQPGFQESRPQLATGPQAPSTPTYASLHPQYANHAPPSPYGQAGGFTGPYTMSPQPMASAYPPHTYGFAHTTIPAHDPSMLPPSPFSPSAQTHPPSHGQPGVPSAFSGYSTELQQTPSQSFPLASGAHSSVSSGSKNASQAPVTGYGNQASYYPPSVSSAPYSFPIQGFAPSPALYQPSFSPSPYQSPYANSPTQDSQSGWWYPQQGVPVTTSQPAFRSIYTGFAPIDFGPTLQPQMNSLHSPLVSMSPGHQQARFMHSQLPLGARPPILTHRPQFSSPEAPPQALSATSQSGPGSPTQTAADGAARERQAPTRKAYHPKAPQNRSEWVMWAGNVPADASHDELWRFFSQPPSQPSAGPSGGVTSMHLISRSNCAFVNFDTEEQLRAAIARFDGLPVRPNDPRCPRLVCRVRRKEDDLKAGVGSQRGTGLHMKWVKQQQLAASKVVDGDGALDWPKTPSSVASDVVSQEDHLPPIGLEQRHKSSGSDSYASTNSSLLAQHFPRRYFILKSLTQYDLDLSVEKGLWATQRHNEGILDQAFRTSAEVFLIFGVNKSGEFYGYAKMAGPIHGEQERRVSWATSSVPDGSPQRSISSRSSRGKGSRVQALADEAILAKNPQQQVFMSPNRVVEESPLPWSPVAVGGHVEPRSNFLRQHTATEPHPVSPRPPVSEDPLSAPAKIGPSHNTFGRQEMEDGYEPEKLKPLAALLAAAAPTAESMDLSPPESSTIMEQRKQRSAPEQGEGPSHVRAIGAIREEDGSPGDPERQAKQQSAPAFATLPSLTDLKAAQARVLEEEGVKRLDTLELERRRDEGVPGAAKGPAAAGEGPEEGADLWGGSFKVEWVRTDRLPFWRTRHIRNPWNQDREVKVSRDGTELEPSVGQALLEEWDRPDPPQSPTGTGFRTRRPGNRAAAASTPAVLQVREPS